jgi:prepilin-type processing-associated H-X9-DG protein
VTKRGHGFSLVETLVVIGVLGVLIGLLVPAVQHVRASASRAACQNNLKQIGVALQNYESAHGRLPPQPYPKPPSGQLSNNPNQLLSWRALILPQVEQSALWESAVRACQTEVYPFRNPPHVGYATVVPLYVCPADGRLRSPLRHPSGDEAAFTSYIGVAGYLTIVPPVYDPGALGVPAVPGPRMTDITDGTSQTVLAGERPPPSSPQAGRWYGRVLNGDGTIPHVGPDEAMLVNPPNMMSPDDFECRMAGARYGPGRIDNPCDRYHFWSLHPTGANWLFADGSVRFLPYSAREILPALATRAAGEVVALPD